MGDSVNLELVLKIIRQNAMVIILFTVISGLMMAMVTFFLLTPRYEAETQILVSQPESSGIVDNQNIETSLQLVNTYRDIILNPIVLGEVADNLSLEQSTGELSEQITVSNEDQSQIITVSVVGDSLNEAAGIADEVAGVFQERVIEIMNVDNVSVLASAFMDADTEQVAPQPVLNITAGLVAGLMLGLALVFTKAFFDKSVRNEEDVGKHLDIPVIGSIDKFEERMEAGNGNEQRS
ncbi:YveK family protein [Lacicoccus alkaliphilus]|uniref:Capsular polysaccharide biosynthesis protein n=1 Tax=Lacicoccus alkaliphilus DSM 16010 TaxID=1123231 RepID=A0A1M7CUC7_9BACL|nr:Wzz/FepE/Etk N-terminal domain-containing protein [Salinicoccus alkaliphilus]SHL70825.1 Capsular polysaccharide biosynthesis protein [Salinicoccus alkaliphilus DSM 16010]